jgi:DNA ligase (NAD+)
MDKSIEWQFDSYMQELLKLESEYPDYAFPNSPTKRVGGSVASQFVKVTHKRPMLSLGNVFNEVDIYDFDRKVKEVSPEATYLCELKIDGLSGALTYENGNLALGATRGNGIIGEKQEKSQMQNPAGRFFIAIRRKECYTIFLSKYFNTFMR